MDLFVGRVKTKRQQIFAALAFARKHLGARSEQLLARKEVQAKLLWRIRSGYSVQNATLAEVYDAAGSDRALACEFLEHFKNDLLKTGTFVLGREIRRYEDTHDLVQAVVGDLWDETARFRYRSRGQFLAYLKQKLITNGKKRAQAARKRVGEEPPYSCSSSSIVIDSSVECSFSMWGSKAQRDQVAYAIALLPEEVSQVLRLAFIKGETVEKIAIRLERTASDVDDLIDQGRQQIKKLIWKNR